jgi:DNA-binding transcriptional MerR regulator
LLELPNVKKTRPDKFSTPGAARILELCENTIRKLADSGELACERDYAGRRLFSQADLDAFREHRAARA